MQNQNSNNLLQRGEGTGREHSTKLGGKREKLNHALRSRSAAESTCTKNSSLALARGCPGQKIIKQQIRNKHKTANGIEWVKHGMSWSVYSRVVYL
jgi:hypothetical protein